MDVLNYKNILQSSDLKATNTRVSVLSYFDHQAKPLDVDSIYEHINAEHEQADRATIYRVVEALYKKGIIIRLEFGEGKYRYELVGDDHHHLICENCGKIEDISECNISDLEKDILKKKGFLVSRHSLEFYGTCKKCQR